MKIIKQQNNNNLWKGQPLKALVFGLARSGGRNNLGRICSFKKGGGNFRKYRIIDFKRNLLNIIGIVRRIEYDPNRSAYIALICYKNGLISYIIAVEGLCVGDQIINYDSLENFDSSNNIVSFFNLGNSLLLKDIPVGSIISNIELKVGFGACFCRAAGTFGIVLNKYKINKQYYILIRLSSNTEYLILENARAVIGMVSNSINRLRNLKKAGVSRNKGIRPTVRGVAMNPIDHPHGGGEGKKSPRRCAMSPWGKLCKGIKTRKNILSNKFILKKRK